MAQEQPVFDLRSRATSYTFDRAETQGLISLLDNAPPPVLRIKQGQTATFNYHNGLDEFSTMHWHGIRLPNAMDGVPYLTQIPIGQDESFSYTYASPDAGTFWYHPHCTTMSQMALGLTGILIVEEADDPGFDADLPLNIKDFHLDDDGQFKEYFTKRGAARGGTLGNVQTTNWQIAPTYDVPAGGLIRVRFAVTDTTRIHKLALPDVSGRIVAWDGHPVEEDIAWPTLEEPLFLGPGQRVDVVLVAPAEEGREVPLTGVLGKTPFTIATLRTTGPSLGRSVQEIGPLPPNPISIPDLDNAGYHEFVFGWTPEGGVSNNGVCGVFEDVFWSINRTPWPGDAEPGSGPLAHLQLGKSYVLRFRNESPNMHPIHLHGLVFKPLRSTMRKLKGNYTDTFLLLQNEIVEVALVADNPGDWAFHCHVIEHQKTGLSGFIRVG